MRKIVAGGAAALAAIAAITRLLRPGWERIDWRKARRPGKIIEIEGTGIHYVERGSGPALVLIHGFGGHTYSFRHQIPAFAADYRVVAVDLKGFGYSEKPRNSDYSLTWQAGMVAKLMEALGIARADVVGHSMGGEVAMRLAAAYPEKVEKLVLAASVSGGRIWTLPPIRLFTPFVLLVARLFGKRIFKRLFYDPRHATEEVRRAYLAPTHIKGYGNALYETARDTRKEGGLHSG